MNVFLINLCLRPFKLNREQRIDRTRIVFDVIKTSCILKIRMVDFLILFKKYFKQYSFKLCARHFKSWLLCIENIISFLNKTVALYDLLLFLKSLGIMIVCKFIFTVFSSIRSKTTSVSY